MTRAIKRSFEDWPGADKAMWVKLTKEAGPLDDNGAFAHLRDISLLGLSTGYGRWLKWLGIADPLAVLEPPADRVTPERLLAWLDSIAYLAAYTRLTMLATTVRVVSAADPDADWTVHRHILSGLQSQAKRAVSVRKTGRILASNVLLDAGRKLMGPLADSATTPLTALRLRRDGAMVAFLSFLPIRLRAMSELRLGQSILVTPTQILVSLSGEMTKNGRPWEAPAPATLDHLMRYYLNDVRPLLIAKGRAPHDMLWVGQSGRPLRYGAVGLTIGDATRKATGIRVPPHFFRDAAASTLARQSPDDARLIRPLLAHSSFETAERHYIQAQGIETGRDFAAVVARLTKGET